jgi:hypothetical protein
VLDDYSPLRAIAGGALSGEGGLFPIRDAWWYVPHQVAQAPGRPELGSDDFTAPNPPVGALLTYHLREALTTAQEARREREKALAARGEDVPFPGFDTLRAEALEAGPKLIVTIADSSGQTVRWLEGPAKAGVHRINWDLRGPSPEPIDLSPPGWRPPWSNPARGPLMAPGRYTASMVVVSAAGVRPLGSPQPFEVKPVPNLPPGTDPAAVAAFQHEVADLRRRTAAATARANRVSDELRHMRAALLQTPKAEPALFARIDAAAVTLAGLTRQLSGDPARQRMNEPETPPIAERVSAATSAWETRQMPTATQRRGVEIAGVALDGVVRALDALEAGELAKLRAALTAAGAPWTPRR